MSNEDRVSVNVIGGTTQVQHGAAVANEAAPRQHPSSGGTTRVSMHGIEHADVVHSTAGDQFSDGAGILATARNAYSGGIARDLNAPSTRLIHENMEISIGTAVALGLVQRDANGNYIETTNGGNNEAAPDAADEQEQSPPDDGPLGFEEETEAAVAHFGNQFPAPIQEAIISQVIGGKGIETSITEMAGMTQEHAKGMVSVAIAAFTGQATAFAASKGVADFGAFSAWANEHEPAAIKSAMRQHVAARSPSAYGALVEKYLTTVQPDTAAIALAGYNVKDSKDGPMVEMHGTWVTVATATRNGWL